MDFAAVSSNKNDNTAIWILRLVRDGEGYKRIFSYAESMNGINSMSQVLRAKQLFYEFDCDYYVLDANGSNKPDLIYRNIYVINRRKNLEG